MNEDCDAILILDDRGMPKRKQPCDHCFDAIEGSCFVFVLPIEEQLIFYLKTSGLDHFKEIGKYLPQQTNISYLV